MIQSSSNKLSMELAVEEIMALRQEGTVKNYCEEFESLLNQVKYSEEISECYAIYLFMDGLEPEIKDVFITWHQHSFNNVKDYISLALKLDANELKDSLSPYDPNSSFYDAFKVFDVNDSTGNGRVISNDVSSENGNDNKTATKVFDEMPERFGKEIQELIDGDDAKENEEDSKKDQIHINLRDDGKEMNRDHEKERENQSRINNWSVSLVMFDDKSRNGGCEFQHINNTKMRDEFASMVFLDHTCMSAKIEVIHLKMMQSKPDSLFASDVTYMDEEIQLSLRFWFWTDTGWVCKDGWKKRLGWIDIRWRRIENWGTNDKGFQVVGKKNIRVKNVSFNQTGVSNSRASCQKLGVAGYVPVHSSTASCNQPNNSRTSVFKRLQEYVGTLLNGAKDEQDEHESNDSNVVAWSFISNSITQSQQSFICILSRVKDAVEISFKGNDIMVSVTFRISILAIVKLGKNKPFVKTKIVKVGVIGSILSEAPDFLSLTFTKVLRILTNAAITKGHHEVKKLTLKSSVSIVLSWLNEPANEVSSSVLSEFYKLHLMIIRRFGYKFFLEVAKVPDFITIYSTEVNGNVKEISFDAAHVSTKTMQELMHHSSQVDFIWGHRKNESPAIVFKQTNSSSKEKEKHFGFDTCD
ncbi:putative protein CELLULOSE SYNTHASE INTERACTIVE/3 [Helianthus debilis subsp. tardiflorus]